MSRKITDGCMSIIFAPFMAMAMIGMFVMWHYDLWLQHREYEKLIEECKKKQ